MCVCERDGGAQTTWTRGHVVSCASYGKMSQDIVEEVQLVSGWLFAVNGWISLDSISELVGIRYSLYNWNEDHVGLLSSC